MSYYLRVIALLAILFALILAAFPVQAKPPRMVYQDSRMTVTLIHDACLNQKALSQIAPKHHGFFRAGIVIWEGKTIGMCWAFTQDGYVQIVDETGDSGVLPLSAFKGAMI